MTYAEFQKFLLLADRMIASSALRKAEYGRGYQNGIQVHFNNPQSTSPPDHYMVADIARRNASRDVHAYARGYSDGCKGLKPESTG
jgi:ribosome modulation factor